MTKNGPFIITVPSSRSHESWFYLPPNLPAEGLSWSPSLDLSGLTCRIWLVMTFLLKGKEGEKKWLIEGLSHFGGL